MRKPVSKHALRRAMEQARARGSASPGTSPRAPWWTTCGTRSPAQALEGKPRTGQAARGRSRAAGSPPPSDRSRGRPPPLPAACPIRAPRPTRAPAPAGARCVPSSCSISPSWPWPPACWASPPTPSLRLRAARQRLAAGRPARGGRGRLRAAGQPPHPAPGAAPRAGRRRDARRPWRTATTPAARPPPRAARWPPSPHALNRMTEQLLENQEKLARERPLAGRDQPPPPGHARAAWWRRRSWPPSAGWRRAWRTRWATRWARCWDTPPSCAAAGWTPSWREGVEGEARRIDRIVRGLLDYARPAPAGARAGGRERRRPRRLQRAARDRARWREVEVALELAEGLPPLAGARRTCWSRRSSTCWTTRGGPWTGRGSITVATRLERYQAAVPHPHPPRGRSPGHHLRAPAPAARDLRARPAPHRAGDGNRAA